VNRSSWPDPAAPGAKPVKLLDRVRQAIRRVTTVWRAPAGDGLGHPHRAGTAGSQGRADDDGVRARVEQGRPGVRGSLDRLEEGPGEEGWASLSCAK
jgi:hypothetical protein